MNATCNTFASTLPRRQPHRLYKCRATIFKWLRPKSMTTRYYTGWRKYHKWIQWIGQGITCKKEGDLESLKIKSLRTCHIATKKHTNHLRFVLYLSYLLHFPISYKFVIKVGGEILNAIRITLQITLASRQDMKRSCTGSS
jgi:hypothetical protein